MPDPWLLALAAAVASVHLVAPKLRRVSFAPRSRWLSFAGGVSIAFVFLELMPAFAEGERALRDASAAAQQVPYLVALGGVALYYGIERAARRHARPQESSRGRGVFAVSIASFALLNAVAAYLLVHEERSTVSVLVFALALGLHLLVADRGLYEHHRHLYHRIGRWVMIAAFGAGALVGSLAEVPALGISVLEAFLAGGFILNVVKEELPAEREARWLAFAAGAGLFAALDLGATLLDAA